MATEACRTCRFSRTVKGTLVCRRYPPTPAGGGHSFFVPVERGDWCGEWMAMRPGAGLPAEIAPKPSPHLGRAAGGHARAAALSDARRREIAQQAAEARWRKP